jgi:hypothetical protein
MRAEIRAIEEEIFIAVHEAQIVLSWARIEKNKPAARTLPRIEALVLEEIVHRKWLGSGISADWAVTGG